MSLKVLRNLLALRYSLNGCVYYLQIVRFLSSTNQLHQEVVEWSAKAFGCATAESILLQQSIVVEGGDNKGSVEETDEEVSKGIPNGGADIKKNVVADG